MSDHTVIHEGVFDPEKERRAIDTLTRWLHEQDQSNLNVEEMLWNGPLFFRISENSKDPLSIKTSTLAIPTRSTLFIHDGNETTLVPGLRHLTVEVNPGLTTQWLSLNGKKTLLDLEREFNTAMTPATQLELGDPNDLGEIMKQITTHVSNPTLPPEPNIFNYPEIAINNGVGFVQQKLAASPATPELVIPLGIIAPTEHEPYKSLLESRRVCTTTLPQILGN